MSVSTLNFGAEGGTAEVTLRAGGSWKASTDAGWLSTNPAGGAGSDAAVPVIVEAAANISSARTATITVTSGKNVKKIEVSQEGVVDDGIPRLSIAEFKKKSDSNTDWYRLTGEVVSFEYDNGYGSFYLNDENNDYIYVWRLASDKETAEDCSKKEDKGTVPSDYKFSTLNLKAGDIITIVAHKNTWNKKEEAYRGYFEAKITGNYPGYSAAKASASWLELPQTAGEDAYDYLCHMMKSGGRNYSIYYSKADRLAKWVAYPLYSSYVSSRSDAYAFDPLVGEEDQPALKSSYQNRTHDGEEFIRGHMVPSAERTGRSNLDVFLSTNIMPQSTELNNGSWGELEGMARKWTGRCDTLYVVVGTDMQNTKYKVKDTRGLEVLVPSGIYRAVLAYKKDEGYRAMAVYFNNSKSDASASIKSKAMSVDELEKKVGVDFFVNLPDDVEKEVEAKDPTKDSWWW
ncbi:MAG: DNA/RNA non-specific endonuclease [Bacteroidia bacterium]|nr:DNA/RNA non-specific endonuclease [Bacteroidia bacterium]